MNVKETAAKMTFPAFSTTCKNYFCHCMSLHVCPGEIIILDNSRLASFLGKNLSFWLSGCSVLIAVSLL